MFTTVAVLGWLTLMSMSVYKDGRMHYDLWRLRSENVQEIDVGGKQFTDATSIERIASDLQSSQWYSVNHGGWGDETTIFVRMKDGSEWYMRAGFHFAQRGAVVTRSGGPDGSGWNFGSVFSDTLPLTLEQLGVPLSHCDTAHDRPCPVQTNGAKEK